MKKDNYQTILNLCAQIISNGTNFIFIMLFTKFLKTEEYGVVSIYQAYVLFFSIVVGLNSQGAIGPAFIHIDKNEHNNFLASIYMLSLFSFAIILFCSMIFIKPLAGFSQLPTKIIVLMLLHSFGTFSYNFLNIKFVYSRKAQLSCLLSIILSLSMILISWIAIRFNRMLSEPYMSRILGLALPYILCSILVSVTIFTKGNPFINLKKYWMFCLPISIPLVFHGLSYILLAQTDKIMLQKLVLDYGVIGVYSFIVTFVHILNAIYTALNNTWVPIYYLYLKSNEYTLLMNRSKDYLYFYTLLTIGFIMIAPEVIYTFADSKYWNGIYLLPIIAISVYIVFLYSFAVNFELYCRKTNSVAVGTSIAAVVNFIMNYLFIPQFGMYGAAIATLLSYLLLFVFHDICARNMERKQYPYTVNFYGKGLVLVAIVSISFYFLLDHFAIRWLISLCDGVYILIRLKKNKTFF